MYVCLHVLPLDVWFFLLQHAFRWSHVDQGKKEPARPKSPHYYAQLQQLRLCLLFFCYNCTDQHKTQLLCWISVDWTASVLFRRPVLDTKESVSNIKKERVLQNHEIWHASSYWHSLRVMGGPGSRTCSLIHHPLHSSSSSPSKRYVTAYERAEPSVKRRKKLRLLGTIVG